MSESYEEKYCYRASIEKLVIYVYLRMVIGWSNIYIHNRNWMKIIKDEEVYFSLEVYGDTETPSSHYKLRIIKNNRNIFKLSLNVMECNREKPNTFMYKCLLESMIRKAKTYNDDGLESFSEIENLFDYYGMYGKNTRNNIRMDIEDIFCRIDDANPELLLDHSYIVSSIANIPKYGLGLYIVENINLWKAIFAFFCLLHNYEVDCTC